MSTDQYPEVSSDDSGLVPQNAPKAEWPKKIRTLTAAELDRLTIDSEGRFYWDGQPVNYQQPAPPPQQQQEQPEQQAPQPAEPVDIDALALLDRAARELSGKPAPEPTVDTDTPPPPAAADNPAVEPVQHSEPTVVALAPPPAAPETPKAAPATAVAPVAHVPPAMPTDFGIPYRPEIERVRVRMSIWQSLALAALIVGLLVGAVGIAVSGLVAAHEWGCRTKLIQQYCPAPPPPPAPPARIDIPA